MKNLKSKMILEVCHHFLLDGNKSVFANHELGANKDMIEDDHQVNLIKWQQTNIIHYKCLFMYGKHYTPPVEICFD
jgi:hypothetical protein